MGKSHNRLKTKMNKLISIKLAPECQTTVAYNAARDVAVVTTGTLRHASHTNPALA